MKRFLIAIVAALMMTLSANSHNIKAHRGRVNVSHARIECRQDIKKRPHKIIYKMKQNKQSRNNKNRCIRSHKTKVIFD